jgi:hypothetical protein
MKYISYLLLAVFAAFLLPACEDESPSDFHEELVVGGFMFVGHRMAINLSKVIPVDQAYYADSVRVTGADVFVTVDGVAYPLTEAQSGIPGTYAAADSAPIVVKGEAYSLLVALNGDTLRASTVAAASLEITEAVLVNTENQVTDDQPDTLEYGGSELRLGWTTDEANFGYAVLIFALDETKYGESCDFGDDNGPGNYFFNWVSQDISGIDLPWLTLCYEGPTRILVYSCDNPWWDFMSTTVIGETRNDPVSNIEGGKGVFCAVGIDTFEIAVTDTLED